MHYEDHMKYLDMLKASMNYALDEAVSTQYAPTRDDFFKHLYAPFPPEDETAVGTAVQQAGSFTLVVAPVGGGKTSIIHNALQHHDPEASSYLLFDFKDRAEEFYGMKGEPTEKMAFIRDVLKRAIASRFLSQVDTKIQFVYNTLSMFFGQQRLHRLLFKYMTRSEENDLKKTQDKLSTLFSQDFEAVAEEHDFVLKHLSCANMILAVKKTLGVENFLVVLDNVDRFSIVDHPILLSVALDMHLGGAGQFGTILAVRNKNLMRYEEAGSKGNVISIISLACQRRQVVTPIRIPEPDGEFSTTILEKRQSYVASCVKHLPETSRKEITCSWEFFSKIREMVNSEFIEERFYNLANHSYRRMLVLHMEFMRYLFRLAAAGAITDENGEPNITVPTLRSYLYRWMYAVHNPNHEFLLDTINRYYQYQRGAIHDPLLCDLEIVILAWFCINRYKSLRIHNSLTSFESIGADTNRVLESIYKLYDVDMTRRYLDLGDSERHITFNELRTENIRVRLTPLGREFVANTITKFQFLNQCLQHPEVMDPDSKEMLSKVSEDLDISISEVIRFLGIVVEVHASALKQIRNTLPASPKWEDYYREHFCVDTLFVIERVCESHLRYLKKQYRELYKNRHLDYVDLLKKFYVKIDSSRKAENIIKAL